MSKIKDEHIDYLNDLRDSGKTNMMGTGRYLQETFGLERYEARDILFEWMKGDHHGS